MKAEVNKCAKLSNNYWLEKTAARYKIYFQSSFSKPQFVIMYTFKCISINYHIYIYIHVFFIYFNNIIIYIICISIMNICIYIILYIYI